MFAAFEGPPKIIRMFGRGLYVEPGEEFFDEVLSAFSPQPLKELYGHVAFEKSKIRDIVLINVNRIRSSCGMGVPIMLFQEQRQSIPHNALRETGRQMRERRKQNNIRSMDGLKGLRSYHSSMAKNRKKWTYQEKSVVEDPLALLLVSFGFVAVASALTYMRRN